MLLLFVLLRGGGDLEPSIELRLRERDVAERGDGVRLNAKDYSEKQFKREGAW